ncbi:hypothetical protein T492DRAFT_1094934 [Pavlovales sp. CCMP2436]|nr:hypothetical protein T492DRAFT_1094934 [Pavlovales sp. CCMP2436]|mmetsp:Transcript_5634/g.14708  ORF Transcript_5634/g.14708 Transcript_5634/m.14708 type:complete len:175 (+) Transcript_5634:121-645(+)
MLAPCLGLLALGLATPTMRYFGFGSNLDAKLMQRRIGSAPISAEPAIVYGHRLAFTAGTGFGPEPGFASLEPAARARCHGVLYTLELPQMARLCASEAVPIGYTPISVRCATYGGQTLSATTLRANGPGRLIEAAFGPIRPSARYLQLIRDGADASGLATEWLEYLAALEPDGS